MRALRILLLTPGTGHFFCGSCLRDNTLSAALRRAGHDVALAPLYLPFHLEDGDRRDPVHMGGINVYLAEKSPALARWIPGALANLLDSPALLRWASRRGDMTDVAALGAMTVSMLNGESGRQAREIEKLVDWAGTQPPFDVIVLSNALLLGLARRLGEALGRPVLCTLQGEAPFLDALAEPHRSEAWALLGERAEDVAAFLAVSDYTARLMSERMQLPPAQVHVVPNGIDAEDFEVLERAPDRPRTVGYLARLCPDKGLGTLVDAFVLLARRPGFEDLRLRAAGVELDADRAYVAEQRAKLEGAGLAERAAFLTNIERAAKLELLASLDAFSVPATYGESFGLYLLEALAAGVPVVQPRHGAFPELLEATGAGRLCAPNDPRSLADELEGLLSDLPAARELGARGRAAVRGAYTSDHMARRVAEVCRMCAEREPTGAGTREGRRSAAR